MESFDRQLNLRVKTVWDGSGMAQATRALKKQVDSLNNSSNNISDRINGGGASGGSDNNTTAESRTRRLTDAERAYTRAHVENARRRQVAIRQEDQAARRAARDRITSMERERRMFLLHQRALAANAARTQANNPWNRVRTGVSNAWQGGTQAWDRARGTAVRGTMALISVMYLLNMAFRTASQTIQPFINMFKQFGTMVIKFTKDLVAKSGEIENVTMRSAGLFKTQAEGNTAWAIEEAVGKPFNFEDIIKATTLAKAYGLDTGAGGSDRMYQSIIPAAEDVASAFGKPLEDAIKAIAQGLSGNMRRLTQTFGTNASIVAQYGGVLNPAGTGISGDPRYREQNLTAMLKSFEARFGGTTMAMANTMKGLSEDMADIWIRVAGEFKSSEFYQYFKDILLQLRNTFIQFSSGKYAGVLQDWTKRFSDGLMGLKPLVDAVLPYLPHYVDAIVTGMENFGKVFKQASESGLIQKVAGGFKVFIDFMFNTGTQVIDLFYRNITEWSVTLLGVADAAIHILPLAAEGLARFIAVIAGTVGSILQEFSGTKAIGDPLVTAANQIWQFADTLAVKMPVIVNTISGGIQQLQQTLINGGNGFRPDGSLPLADRVSAQTQVPKTAMSAEDLSDGVGGEGEGTSIGSVKRATTLLAGEVEKMDNKFGSLYNEAISKSFDISQAQRDYNAILNDELNMKQDLLSIEEEIASAQKANDDARVEGLKLEKEALQGQIDLAGQGKDAIKKQITVAEELATAQKKMTDGQKKMTELAAEFLKPMGALGMRFIRKNRGGAGASGGPSSVVDLLNAETERFNTSRAMVSATAGGGGAAAPYSYAYGGGATPSSLGGMSGGGANVLDSSFGGMIGTSSAVNPMPASPTFSPSLIKPLDQWTTGSKIIGGAVAGVGGIIAWNHIVLFFTRLGTGVWNALTWLWSLGSKARALIDAIKMNWPLIRQAFGAWAQGAAEQCFILFFGTPSTNANPGAPSALPGGPTNAPGGGVRRASLPSGSNATSVQSSVGGEKTQIALATDVGVIKWTINANMNNEDVKRYS